MYKTFLERALAIGLADPKYRFIFGPEGFPLTHDDIAELERIAQAASSFIADADAWYRSQASGGSHWTSVLQRGIPRDYIRLGLGEAMPQTVMIDTVWTHEGWRIVEIDVTNRNGLGFPLVMRHLHGLPSIWIGNDAAWRQGGWSGVVQFMAKHHRFYEPYYRFFLKALDGTLIPETEADILHHELETAKCLLDLPVLNRTEGLTALFRRAAEVPVGIPPKHHLSSKALLALPWETSAFVNHPVRYYLPPTYLLRPNRAPENGNFFVKLLQSGGAHGTFHNDRAKLAELAARRPQAILQEGWRIAPRPIAFCGEEDEGVAEKFIRLSLYVTPDGTIVDADVTASDAVIVHGGAASIMTVPVLARA